MNSRTLVGAVLALAMTFARPAHAEPPELKFQAVASEKGRYAVEMPGTPVEDTEDLPDGMKRYSLVVPLAARNAAFHTSYIELKESSVKGKDPRKVIEAFRSGFRQGAKFEG